MYGTLEVMISFISTDKRVFRPFMRFAKPRTHQETLQWAELVEEEGLAEYNGILGKSLLFQIPDFDIINDVLPEAMHLLDGGFTKNTCGRTFNNGTSAQTKPGYKRSPVAPFSTIMK